MVHKQSSVLPLPLNSWRPGLLSPHTIPFMMYHLSVILIVFSIFFLSAQGAPLPSKLSLGKRSSYGKGTWFYDGLGACGEENSNSDSIVALSTQIYNNGAYCNQWVTVTNTATGQSAYGTVTDECQSCSAGDLDMSVGLFEQLGQLSTGVLSIDWNFMPVGWSPS